MKSKVLAVAVTGVFALPCLATDRMASSLEYRGECQQAVLPTPPVGASAEGIGATLATLAVTAIATEGINYAANWLKELEEDLKGIDKASYFGPLYCNVSVEQSTIDGNRINLVNVLGFKPEIVYKRVRIEGDEFKETEIELTTQVEVAVTSRVPIGGLLLLRPSKLVFEDSIAARGSTKDIAVTYDIEYFGAKDDKGKPAIKKFTSDPYLIEKVKEGETIDLLAHKSDVILFELPSAAVTYPTFKCAAQGKETLPSKEDDEAAYNKKVGKCENNHADNTAAPFKIMVTLSETNAGDGYKLVAAIAKSAGEGLESERDDLVKELVDAIVGSSNEKSEDSGDKDG